jgi:hypothetical protein
MTGRSFDQDDWIIGHILQTTVPLREECRGAPPPDIPTGDPTAAGSTSSAASATGASDDPAIGSGGSTSGGSGGLRRNPEWPDDDWMRLMMCLPLPPAGDELSAIRAWDLVCEHPRRGELLREDYGAIIEELKPKINCYGCVYCCGVFFFCFLPFLPAPTPYPTHPLLAAVLWCFMVGLTEDAWVGLEPWLRRSRLRMLS